MSLESEIEKVFERHDHKHPSPSAWRKAVISDLSRLVRREEPRKWPEMGEICIHNTMERQECCGKPVSSVKRRDPSRTELGAEFDRFQKEKGYTRERFLEWVWNWSFGESKRVWCKEDCPDPWVLTWFSHGKFWRRDLRNASDSEKFCCYCGSPRPVEAK